MPFSDLIMQSPDPKKIKCTTCKNRNKTVIEINGVKKPVGVTKTFCEKYKGYPGADKPYDILFQNADCKYYEEDKDVNGN